MPSFPELGKYTVLPIDPSSDHSGVALSPITDDDATSMASAARAGAPPAQQVPVDPNPPSAALANLMASMGFASDATHIGTPSDRLASPLSAAPTPPPGPGPARPITQSVQRRLFSATSQAASSGQGPPLGQGPVLGVRTRPPASHHPPSLSGTHDVPIDMISTSSAPVGGPTHSSSSFPKPHPKLRFHHQTVPEPLPWLRPFTPPSAQAARWWYDCIPLGPITLKRSKDDPAHLGKHDLQWSGKLFRNQTNNRVVDVAAMLGGVHLGPEAVLHLESAPSVVLGDEWRFLPGKVAWPFLSAVCDKSRNDDAVLFFNLMLENYTRFGNPILGPTLHLLPQFRRGFFGDSSALMTGFRRLQFHNGLAYADLSPPTLPNHISVWHFLSSLDILPDGVLSPLGLSAPELAQVITNFRVCFEHIYANGRDYPRLPEEHKSPVTWQGTFYGGLVAATRHLLSPSVVAAWEDHRRRASGHGFQLTVGFIHHLGLLMRLFQDWLRVAECDQEYCQPFIAFPPDDPSDLSSKTGYVLAHSKSQTKTFLVDFQQWEAKLDAVFGAGAIQNRSYSTDEAFSFPPPIFLTKKPEASIKETKRGAPAMSSTGGPAKKQHRGAASGETVPATRPSSEQTSARSSSAAAGSASGPPPGYADSSSGKLSAAIPLLKWSGIETSTTLPIQLKAWRTAAPPGTVRYTPKIAGKFLCFKFCTEGLFCKVGSGKTCPFTHVDLSQPDAWSREALEPLLNFLTQPGVDNLGLSLTPAGIRATAQGTSS